MRYIVFGDTGGHSKQLLAGLVEAGMDASSLRLPEDVTIIHLGDLIHKGPDSAGVMELVDKVANVNPGQWIQILGNHEFQYIQGAPIFWQPGVSVHEIAMLGRWIQSGFARVAFALPDIESVTPFPRKKTYGGGKGALFTHAGLTYGFWKGIGKPLTAEETADILNSLPVKRVAHPGVMLGGGPSNIPYSSAKVGPVWALASYEVFDSWQDVQDEMPFLQFHGHTNCYQWSRNEWFANTSRWFRNETSLVPAARLSVTQLAGSFLCGVDPGFSKTADTKSQPFVTLNVAD